MRRLAGLSIARGRDGGCWRANAGGSEILAQPHEVGAFDLEHIEGSQESSEAEITE